MNEAKESLLNDAGEIIPNARKHLAESTGKRVQEVCELSDFWPEPNWKQLVDAGMDAELAASKYFIYKSLRNKPRAHGVRNISGVDWAEAYRVAVVLVREFVESTHTTEGLLQLNTFLLAKNGKTFDDLKGASVADNIVYWGAGLGGDRILKSVLSGTLRLRQMRKWQAKLGWPYSDDALITSIVPVELTDNTWRVGRVEGKHWVILSKSIYNNEADVVQAAIDMAKAEVSTKTTSTKLIPRRPSASKEQIRLGPDFRNGSDVSAEILMEEFGLRGIQYGNSVSIKDRQRWLNQTFDSMADLADMLGMRRKWLGLKFNGQSLALAIGARGKGSFAAHYEPSLKVINQTYRSGVGAIAHEWGHSLDDRLGSTLGYSGFASSFAWRSTCGKTEKALLISEAVSQIGLKIDKSQFERQASLIASQHRAGSYWTDRQELFARAFEAYIQDKLIVSGRCNPWLVHGTLEADYVNASVIASPYPNNAERKIFYDCFENLISVMLDRK